MNIKSRVWRGTAAMLMGGALLAGAASAHAQSDEAPMKFYIFGEQVFDGGIKGPSASVYTSTERAKFEPLLKLKKSFLPAIVASGKEPALK